MLMRKINPEFFSCKRKSRYPNEHIALKYASKLERERGVKLEVYFCGKCKGWHLTSQYEYKKESV